MSLYCQIYLYFVHILFFRTVSVQLSLRESIFYADYYCTLYIFFHLSPFFLKKIYFNSIENCNVYSRVFIFKIRFFIYIFRLKFIGTFLFLRIILYTHHSYSRSYIGTDFWLLYIPIGTYYIILHKNFDWSIIILVYFVITYNIPM